MTARSLFSTLNVPLGKMMEDGVCVCWWGGGGGVIVYIANLFQ